MKILEIIHLRSSGTAVESLCARIKESVAVEVEGEKTEVVTVYRRKRLETDIAVHIQHLDAAGDQRSRALGLRLAKALRDLGLVGQEYAEQLARLMRATGQMTAVSTRILRTRVMAWLYRTSLERVLPGQFAAVGQRKTFYESL